MFKKLLVALLTMGFISLNCSSDKMYTSFQDAAQDGLRGLAAYFKQLDPARRAAEAAKISDQALSKVPLNASEEKAQGVLSNFSVELQAKITQAIALGITSMVNEMSARKWDPILVIANEGTEPISVTLIEDYQYAGTPFTKTIQDIGFAGLSNERRYFVKLTIGDKSELFKGTLPYLQLNQFALIVAGIDQHGQIDARLFIYDGNEHRFESTKILEAVEPRA